MAELLRLTLDLRRPPDPSVIAPLWAAAGIKHSTPEVCRMLLLAQLAEPLDEAGWQGAALIVGSALDAVPPERGQEAEAAEPEADPAESVVYAEMAAAFERPLPLGEAAPNEVQFSFQVPNVPIEDEDASTDPEPILIEDDDAPAEGEGVPPEPEPVAEAAAELEVAQAEPGAEVAPEPEAAQVEAELEPGPETLESRMAGTMADVLVEAMVRREAEPSPVEPEAEDEGQPPAAEVWTARRDLQLVVAMTGGQGTLHTSRKMGLSREECVRRFKELLPRPGALAQQALIKRLRARIDAEGSEVEP